MQFSDNWCNKHNRRAAHIVSTTVSWHPSVALNIKHGILQNSFTMFSVLCPEVSRDSSWCCQLLAPLVSRNNRVSVLDRHWYVPRFDYSTSTNFSSSKNPFSLRKPSGFPCKDLCYEQLDSNFIFHNSYFTLRDILELICHWQSYASTSFSNSFD